MNNHFNEIRTLKNHGEYHSDKRNSYKKIGAAVIATSILVGGLTYGLSNIDNIKSAYAEYNHKTLVAEVPFVINEQGKGIEAHLVSALKDYDEQNNTDYLEKIPYEQVVYESQEAGRSNREATGNSSVSFGDGFKVNILKTDRNDDINISVTSSAAETTSDNK